MARRRLAVGVPFTTLHSTFARWARLGLWRRLGQRLAGDWRRACDDEVLPSAVVADSRSLRSAPTAWTRGIDGGKLIKGVKVFAICDKHGSLFDLELGPANTDDRAGTCRSYRGWPRSVSKAICLAIAASRVPFRRRRWRMTSTSRSRPAERGTGVSAQRDQMGGGTPLRLVEPLPAAQHRVRPRA